MRGYVDPHRCAWCGEWTFRWSDFCDYCVPVKPCETPIIPVQRTVGGSVTPDRHAWIREPIRGAEMSPINTVKRSA